MERFSIIQPSAILAPYVKHYWLLQSDDVKNVQRVIPTGNIQLIFHRANPLICNDKTIPITSVSGQLQSYLDLSATGFTNMITVVFQAFGAKAFFEMPMYELSDTIVSADDLNSKALLELEDKILNCSDDSACINYIERYLIKLLHPYKDYNYKRIHSAIEKINLGENGISVSKLADSICLSEKQFQRIFAEHVGIGPKEFMRIVRFHKALYTLQCNPNSDFTSLAYICGYYDQAHLTNEFKAFSGYNPGQYISLCDPYSDYFSS